MLSAIEYETNPPDIVELVYTEIKKQAPQRMPNIDIDGIKKLVLILYPIDLIYHDAVVDLIDPVEELKYKQKIVTDICQDIEKCLSLYSKGNVLYNQFLFSLGIDRTRIATLFSVQRDFKALTTNPASASEGAAAAVYAQPTYANMRELLGPKLQQSDTSSFGSGGAESDTPSSAATVPRGHLMNSNLGDSQFLEEMAAAPPRKLSTVFEEGVPDITMTGRNEGGSSRRRLHKNRHRRRTQYTKKYKRSNSSKYYTTIKRRKLYRKHNHTIKKRKSLRQKRRN